MWNYQEFSGIVNLLQVEAEFSYFVGYFLVSVSGDFRVICIAVGGKFSELLNT